MNEFIFKSYGNSKQSISYCEVDKCKAVVELKQQLDQLKADNDKLREIMHKDSCTHYVLGECSQEHHSNCVGKNQCIKDLEQENEELKEYIKHLHNLCGNETDKQYGYKQTLSEIKEIAESCGWNFGSEILYKRIEQILQKISEVVDD